MAGERRESPAHALDRMHHRCRADLGVGEQRRPPAEGGLGSKSSRVCAEVWRMTSKLCVELMQSRGGATGRSTVCADCLHRVAAARAVDGGKHAPEPMMAKDSRPGRQDAKTFYQGRGHQLRRRL